MRYIYIRYSWRNASIFVHRVVKEHSDRYLVCRVGEVHALSSERFWNNSSFYIHKHHLASMKHLIITKNVKHGDNTNVEEVEQIRKSN